MASWQRKSKSSSANRPLSRCTQTKACLLRLPCIHCAVRTAKSKLFFKMIWVVCLRANCVHLFWHCPSLHWWGWVHESVLIVYVPPTFKFCRQFKTPSKMWVPCIIPFLYLKNPFSPLSVLQKVERHTSNSLENVAHSNYGQSNF